MKHLFYILTLVFCFGCNGSVISENQKTDRVEEIVCKHPRGHIVVYKVSGEEADLPHNFRGGLWSFKTIDGRKIRSTNCHLETIVQ